MIDNADNSDARERVLEAAETLFAQRGYNAVTLRDIAAQVGIRHTSLYHHVPGGKEELFVEVTERHLQRHERGLTKAISEAAPHIRSQLRAAADWLLSQPPMDLIRMVYSDMPAIDPAHAERLSMAAYTSLLIPFQAALRAAQGRGEIGNHNLGLVAGGILGMIETMHTVPPANVVQSRAHMAYELLDIVLEGLLRR